MGRGLDEVVEEEKGLEVSHIALGGRELESPIQGYRCQWYCQQSELLLDYETKGE